MLAEELLATIDCTLTPETPVEEALQHFMENELGHLPVIGGQYLGLLSSAVAVGCVQNNKTVGELREDFLSVSIGAEAHLFDVIRAFKDNEVTVLPVLNEALEYQGCIHAANLLHQIANSYGYAVEGGIIQLNVAVKDYSMSQVASIVESNRGKILQVMTDAGEEQNLLVTLKISTNDIRHIIASFRRFEYQVKAYHEVTFHEEVLNERFDLLMKYLNL